jgi:hypothetical protein
MVIRCDITTPIGAVCVNRVSFIVAGKTFCCKKHIFIAIDDEIQHTNDGKVTVEYYSE